MQRHAGARVGEFLFNQPAGGDFRLGQPAREVADAEAGGLCAGLGADVGDAQRVLAFEDAEGAGDQLLRGVGDDDGTVAQQFAAGNRPRPGGQRVLRGDGELVVVAQATAGDVAACSARNIRIRSLRWATWPAHLLPSAT